MIAKDAGGRREGPGQGPLQSVRVVDLTHNLLGPYSTWWLAEMGAEVIKVERPPAGDMARSLTRGHNPGMSPVFLNLNYGKKSLAIDVKQDAGLAALLEVVRSADVFVHNMRSGAVEALGLGYRDLVALNAGLIYCVSYGYGKDGPYAGKPAYDDVIQGASGIASLQGGADGPPRYVASVIADKTVGMVLLAAILAALVERGRTGKGQEVEVPMFETMAGYALAEQMEGWTFDPPTGPPVYPRTLSPYRKPYRTLDAYISVLLYTDAQWQRFLKFVDRPDLAGDDRFKTADRRTANIDDVYSFVEGCLATRSSKQWLAELEAIDVPAMPVQTIAQLFEDEHLNAVGMFEFYQHPTEGRVRHVRSPLRFSNAGGRASGHAPSLGEHSVEVLECAGVDPMSIAQLVKDGVIIDGRPVAISSSQPESD